MKKAITKTIDLAGKTLTLEINKLAPQANTSVVAKLGETAVLVTLMLGNEKPGFDGVPLTVDFVERLYAGGLIKGSRWVKREGRATDEATLTGRMIDRTIRPLFPKDMVNEVQVVVTLLAIDGQHDHDMVALNAISAALAISNIPWDGPVAASRVGYMKEEEKGEILSPLIPEMELSDLDLVVSSNDKGVIMIEAGAKILGEDKILSAIDLANQENQKIISAIKEIQKEIGAPKFAYKPTTVDQDLLHEIEKDHKKDIEKLIDIESPASKTDNTKVDEFKKSLVEKYVENPSKNQIPGIVDYLFKKALRARTLSTKKRVDGRSLTEVRPISVEVGLLPRTHGTGLFQRGLSQVLSVVTLGNPSMEQWIETAEGMEEKRYIHHYNSAAHSTGETGKANASPGRREIGHGALAEKALLPVVPSSEKFPYTIRVVSEVLSQNGSTSMASTCGSTLALMDAGVPLLAPVSGVAMGLVAEDSENYVILTDLRGEEDFHGNMDFKVAGTEEGVTAIQLDIKLGDKFRGLTMKMVGEILAQAKAGRLEILEKMLAVIATSRKNVSQYAPKVVTVQVPLDRVGEIIGPGGKNIKNIIATTKAAVDVDDDGKVGTVTISSTDEEAVKKAKDWIEGMIREVEVGEEFEGEVKRILNFGAFVEFLPGKEGLVHVSKMTSGFVSNPEEVVHLGDKVKVKVMEIDDMGRINLAMYWGPKDQDSMPVMGEQPQRQFNQFGNGPRRGGFGGPRRGGFGGGRDNNRGGRGNRF